MTVRRLLATATLITVAAFTLVACNDDTGTTGAAAGGSAQPSVSSTLPTTGSPSASATSRPTGTVTSAKPVPSKSGPAVNCTAAAKQPGHQVINVVSTNTGSAQLSASKTKFVCGPGVDDDGYFEAVGAAGPYSFATGATAQLFVFDPKPGLQDVPIAKLLDHANACVHGTPVDRPYGCFGNNYDVTVNSSGAITHIAELYHP